MFSIVMAIFAFLLRLALDDVLVDRMQFLFMPFSVLTVALLAGCRYGLLTALVGALLTVNYFLQSPISGLDDWTTLERVISFSIVASGLSILGGLSRRHFLKAQQSVDWFKAIANSSPFLIWLTDSDCSIAWVNAPWLEFTGRTMDEELGGGWADHLDPTDRSEIISKITGDMMDQKKIVQRIRLRRHDGVYRTFLLEGQPSYQPDQRFSGYVGACTDITDQELGLAKLEASIEAERAARAEAEMASRMKDEFVANLSHELRTPLTAILGWVELLKRKGEGDEMIKEGLSTIFRSAKIQTKMIEDLLDVSRISTGKITVDLAPIDLHEAIIECVESFLRPAEEKQIRLVAPDRCDSIIVLADGERLQQILSNLVANAIKFTPIGGVIEIRCNRLDSYAEISVRDSGEGISATALPHIFERFQQASLGSARKHGGLGIGLAIAKQLIELHDGVLTASSEGINKGATFTFTLPLAANFIPIKEPIIREYNLTASDFAALKGAEVLIVEDDPATRDVVAKILAGYEMSVRQSASALEALDAIKSKRPDVLVSDIGMPEVDGYDLIAMVRSLPPQAGGRVPAIAMTAYARSRDRQMALSAGYGGFVTKPIDAAQLVATIVNLLDHRDN